MNTTEATLTEYIKGYMEAAIDAEGSLSLVKLRSKRCIEGYEFNPVGRVFNTDINFLKNIQNMIGDGSINVHQRYHHNENYNPSYHYAISRKSMRRILPQLNLIIKRRQKEIVLEALELLKGHKGSAKQSLLLGKNKTDRLNELVTEIRGLNQRGLNSNWNKPRKKVKP